MKHLALLHRSRLPRALSQALQLTLLLTLLAACLTSSFGCTNKKVRRFGASCGQSSECESGLCYNGFCTSSCTSGASCSSGVCIEKVCQPSDDDYDHDGLLNSWEAKHGLNAEKIDTDADGIADNVEVGSDLAHPLDHNGDGVPDALQSNLVDSDADCIVDAYDKLPGKIDPLPDSATLCGSGVCAGKSGEVTVICTPSDPTATGAVVAGCKGCACNSSSIADFQTPETWCDGLDNDCNGKTDENATLGGQPLGGGCVASQGVCALTGKLGKIECKNKQAVCSTDNGSESGGGTETCNLQDDDCNGTTDDGFKFQGSAVGQSCDQCGFTPAVCPGSGAPMNGAVVGCTADGQYAACMGLPFDDNFASIALGAPEPRDTWSMGWRESTHKVSVFSGSVASVSGLALRDEEWFLEVDPAGSPMPWQRAQWQDPKERANAAIAADPTNSLLWLIGGVNSEGTLQTEVFSSPNPNEWHPAPVAPGADAVAALPPSALSIAAGKSAPPAFVLYAGAKRALLTFDRHYQRPQWYAVGQGAPSWQDPLGDTSVSSTDVLCAAQTPDQQAVFAAQSDGTWLRFTFDGSQVAATVQAVPGSVTVHPGAQCVVDGDGQFHALGGYSAAAVVDHHQLAAIVGSGASAQLGTLSKVTPTQDEVAIFARSGGMAAWSPSLGAVVLAGGETNSGSGRFGRPDVQVWKPNSASTWRADKLRPRARFAHAGGYWPQQSAYCIAGGLTAELPEGGVPRVVPVQDAWCASKDGEWTQKVAAGIRYAYGAAAMDTAGQRLVMAGGLALQGDDFKAVAKLWGQALMSNGAIDPTLAPTAAVQTVVLGAGLASPGSATTAMLAGAPQVAAPAFSYDSKRNRLILVDGYGPSGEVQLFQVLDLKTLTWTDVKALLPNAADNKPFLPMARYGALALYDPSRDLVAVIGGSLRHPSGGIGYDVVNGPQSGSVSTCMLTGYVPLDLSHTLYDAAQPLTNPQFVAQPLPLFASLTKPTKDETLLSPWLGGPVFAPVIYDSFGGHAWLAVPDAPPPYLGPSAPICDELGESTVNPLHMNHQLSLDVGACGGQVAAMPSLLGQPGSPALKGTPSALFSTAFQYSDSDRAAWISGGLEPDGAVSSELSRLGQGCKAAP